MGIGIPQLEIRTNATILRGNLKGIVETIKALQSGIEEVKQTDRVETLNALQNNLKAAIGYGKQLQERIKIQEK